jgi:hypothetical protein
MMRNHRPILANEVLIHSRLKEIQHHAELIQHLNEKISAQLPEAIQSYVRVANIRHGQLVLEAASAAIKMKVDYTRLQLLNTLRNQAFPHLISIEVVINPEIYRTASPSTTSPSGDETTTPRHPISSRTADTLKTIANRASPKVRKRLENLARLADNGE